MEVKGLDVDDATDYLYQFAGEITESDWQERMLALFEMDKQESRIEPMPYFNERVIERWIGYHEWLENKGISEDIAYRFRVGFDPDHVKQKKGKVAYDGPAIIFPHFWDGKLIGWQERWLDDERPKWVSKYTNTHDFPRERTLFNWHGAFNRGNQRTIICESVPTTLFIESANINSIATFGDQITEGQLKLLRGFQAGVILSRDNDNAGAHWRDKITEYLKRFIPVYWLPQVGHPKDDLADVFASDYEALREFIKNETYPAP
jgi:DNA primase